MLERRAPDKLGAGLAETRALAKRTVGDLRRIVAALSPVVLERLGLERALHQLAARFGKMHRAKIRLRCTGSYRELVPPIQEAIYRVAQESLQNIAKHSQATH